MPQKPPRPIEFIDLPTQQRTIRTRLLEDFSQILAHGRYIDGPEIAAFEDRLCTHTGASYAVGCASGTDALIMALMSLQLTRSDAVVIPALTFMATANAVLFAGATPVFADVEEKTCTISARTLEEACERVQKHATLRLAAVIPVDLYGIPADYPELTRVVQRYGAAIIADAAQSFGGAQKERPVGTLAPLTCLSFYPGKSLGAYGDAGAVLGMRAQDEAVLRSIRWHGTEATRSVSIRPGINGRIDSFQAAVLLRKLDLFDEEYAKRCRIAQFYKDNLASYVAFPQLPPDTHAGHGYFSILTHADERDSLRAFLRQNTIPSAVYYPEILPQMPAFAPYASACPASGAEAIKRRVLSLPMHPYLDTEQCAYICEMIGRFYEARRGKRALP